MVPEIVNDVEGFPPAVHDLDARLVQLAAQAVAETDGPSQARAAANQGVCILAHLKIRFLRLVAGFGLRILLLRQQNRSASATALYRRGGVWAAARRNPIFNGSCHAPSRLEQPRTGRDGRRLRGHRFFGAVRIYLERAGCRTPVHATDGCSALRPKPRRAGQRLELYRYNCRSNNQHGAAPHSSVLDKHGWPPRRPSMFRLNLSPASAK
jgi:hypothetical protein